MSIQQQINTDIITAMKAKEEAALRALRAIKSALLLAATADGAKGEVDDEQATKILQKLAKQRKESMDIFIQNNRAELAEAEKEELTVINKYLPAQMSEDEVKAALEAIISQEPSKEFAKIMPIAMKQLAGKADGKIISGLLKSILG